MYRSIRGSKSLKYVINSSRRLGKSYLLTLMAVEDAIKHPGVPLRFAAPTQKALKKIIIPLMRKICLDMPDEFRPQYHQVDNVFTFPNKSEIHMAGANGGHAESLRGTDAFRCYVDEAGFISELPYLVEDILMPQLLTSRGQLILSSTPPKTPAHDFVTYALKAEAEGNYAKYTIHEAGYPKDLIELFKKEAGGENSTTWRREYLCEFVVDAESAITPEWSDQYVVEYPRPSPALFPHLYRYVAMDIGVRDFTAVLFGYYDFPKAKIIVEDEIIINGPYMTTDKLAKAIREKEKELWGDLKVHLRVADNNNIILVQDLTYLHQLPFAVTNKDTLEAMVNQMRIFIRGGRVLVHPRCRSLVGCLKNGIWNERRTEFDRSETFGHYDAIAALMYWIRNTDVYTNPIPPLFGVDEENTLVRDVSRTTNEENALKTMLGMGRRN